MTSKLNNSSPEYNRNSPEYQKIDQLRKVFNQGAIIAQGKKLILSFADKTVADEFSQYFKTVVDPLSKEKDVIKNEKYKDFEVVLNFDEVNKVIDEIRKIRFAPLIEGQGLENIKIQDDYRKSEIQNTIKGMPRAFSGESTSDVKNPNENEIKKPKEIY
jgi:hypothetical protein